MFALLHFGTLRTELSADCMRLQLEELANLLNSPPTSVDLALQPIPDTDLQQIFDRDPPSVFATIKDLEGLAKPNGQGAAVIVAIPPDHPVAVSARQAEPAAQWGAACGRIAFSYCPDVANKHLLWHEVLHTLGADDCYALPNPGPICCTSNCIMQFQPTVGDWPFICNCNSNKIVTRLSDSGA